jgi:hypothetical protein
VLKGPGAPTESTRDSIRRRTAAHPVAPYKNTNVNARRADDRSGAHDIPLRLPRMEVSRWR